MWPFVTGLTAKVALYMTKQGCCQASCLPYHPYVSDAIVLSLL